MKLSFTRAQVDARGGSALALRIDLIGIERIDLADEAVTASDRDPIGVDRAARRSATATRAAPTAVVLQATVDRVVAPRSHRHVIELADGHVIVMVPMRTLIVRHVDPAVVAQDDVASVARVDPHGMMVDVHIARRVVGLKRLAAVLAQVEFRAQHPDVVGRWSDRRGFGCSTSAAGSGC